MKKISPHHTMSDEGGGPLAWLADAYSIEDIIEEYDYLNLTPEKLHEQHYAARWTTEKERADPDVLYDLFGDYEYGGYDTSIYYWRVPPDWKPKNQYAQGPFRYYELP